MDHVGTKTKTESGTPLRDIPSWSHAASSCARRSSTPWRSPSISTVSDTFPCRPRCAFNSVGNRFRMNCSAAPRSAGSFFYTQLACGPARFPEETPTAPEMVEELKVSCCVSSHSSVIRTRRLNVPNPWRSLRKTSGHPGADGLQKGGLPACALSWHLTFPVRVAGRGRRPSSQSTPGDASRAQLAADPLPHASARSISQG